MNPTDIYLGMQKTKKVNSRDITGNVEEGEKEGESQRYR